MLKPGIRQAATLAVIALLLAGAFGLGRWLYAPQTVRVGYIGTLSGKYAALGLSARNGALLAVDVFNAQNHGRFRLELDVRDDQGDPARAVALAGEFRNRGLALVVGPFLSSSAKAVCDALPRLPGLLVISPTASTDEVGGRDDNFFRLPPSTGDMGAKLAAHALSVPGLKNVAIILDTGNRTYGDSISSAFRKDFEAGGGRVTAVFAFASGGNDPHAALLAKALSSRPQGLLFICGPLDTALFCQKLREKDSALTVLSASWGVSPKLLENGGPAVNGLFFYLPYDVANRGASYAAFQTAYRQRFGVEPTHAAVLNYDAVRLLRLALDKGGTSAASGVRQAILSQGTVAGLQGDFHMDAHGDATWPLYPHTIKDGRIIRAPQP